MHRRDVCNIHEDWSTVHGWSFPVNKKWLPNPMHFFFLFPVSFTGFMMKQGLLSEFWMSYKELLWGYFWDVVRNADEMQMQPFLNLGNFQLFYGNQLAWTTIIKICECCLGTTRLIPHYSMPSEQDSRS